MRWLIVLSTTLLFWPFSLQASQVIDGYFLAEQNCPAVHSIREQTNPGQLTLKPGQRYKLKAQNKTQATHYLVEIPVEQQSASVQQRWVSIQCGQRLAANAAAPEARPSAAATASQDLLLAISWQPAFCQTHQAKPECKTQTAERLDAKQLSLHGLWPQPKDNAYCEVDITLRTIDRRGADAWHLLPAFKLSPALERELGLAMPGVVSHLHRHEWYKHGTCYGQEPETYFRHSVALLAQLNQSPVSQLFQQNIGKTLQATQIQHAFDQAFGKGAGQRVNVRCDGKWISELWLNLRGTPKGDNLAELLQAAPKITRLDCTSGKVDAAGY